MEQFSTELSSLLEEEVPAYDPLVLLTGTGQFVFLYGVPEPMKATPVSNSTKK